MFAIMYHNMQKLNKAAVKYVIFGVEYVYGCPRCSHTYFNVDLITGIGILRCNWFGIVIII